MSRGKAKTRVGIVRSSKMDKTVIVDVTIITKHKRYKKPIKRTSSFKAHDERNECNVGDKVFIIESRPLSRTKRWRVNNIIERAGGVGEDDLSMIESEGGVQG